MLINKDRLRRTFIELIEINSFYPDDFGVQEYVLNRLQHKHITCLQDDFGNIIASLEGNADKPAVMLNTHVDIPEDTPQVAYRENADGDIEGTGKTILGADPKTGLAVLIELALALADDFPYKRAPVDFVFTRGEEQGLLGARALDLTKVRAREGLVIDEDGPTCVVVTQAPGSVKFNGTFIGTTAHSREPWLGINAIQMVADAIAQVPLGYTDASQSVTWNLGVLEAGAAVNSIPCSATFLAEMRSFDHDRLQAEAQRVYDVFSEVAAKAGGRLEAQRQTLYDPYFLDEQDPLLVKMNTVFNELSLEPSYLHTFGASDANVFNTRGIRCAAVGSGYYNAHQYVERADIHDMQILADFLDRFVRL